MVYLTEKKDTTERRHCSYAQAERFFSAQQSQINGHTQSLVCPCAAKDLREFYK